MCCHLLVCLINFGFIFCVLDNTGFEIMQASNAVRNMIRENKTYQIDNAISTGAKDGMLSMDQSIQNLYRQGRIEKNTALAYADTPDMMKRLLT